jgi:hypothetical protein
MNAGLDDDCDGEVDEDCPCNAGMVQSCFKGNPAYASDPGCFPGTQHCTEFGWWDECIGGVHALPPDNCYQQQVGCHAIQSYPFATVHLKDGTGTFSDGALSEAWTVDCPPGVSPCPAVTGSNPVDEFRPLQSGEYTVHYAKQTANGQESCDYPLFVGAPGLRVELDWEHDLGGTGVDLDLHMHKPGDTSVWKGNGGSPVDCAYANCVFGDFVPQSANAPAWFGAGQPPAPMDWYADPVPEKNTCYFAPRGVGALWEANAQGCHNPRLDLDNITCNPAVTDVDDPAFCAPENINVDYPPADQWIRIGVHYFGNHGQTYSVHPRVRIFCNAELMAELGPGGFDARVTFAPADGINPATSLFWLVADVRFLDDPCAAQRCEVKTIYADEALQTPLLSDVPSVSSSFFPDYPP